MARHDSGKIAALSAMGAATSLGGAVQAAAAARAGLARPSIIPGCLALDAETNEPQPVTGMAVLSLTDGFEGIGRLARLGEAALLDFLPSAPRFDPGRTGLLLALPRSLDGAESAEAPAPARPDPGEPEEQEPAEPPLQRARRLADLILSSTELPTPPASIQCFLDERTGTTEALRRAITALEERRCDAVLLLAVDSLADPVRAEQLLRDGRIKTPDHATGFVPGEAAVALLLERADSVRRRREVPLAVLSSPVSGAEPAGGDGTPRTAGRVLHDVLAAARPELNPQERGSVYLDLNGESPRAQEWGNVLVRARRSSWLDQWTLQVPAIAFGETGAASPLLSVLLAARSFSRGYAPGDHALVAVAGEDRLRAAFAVRRGDASEH